MHKVVSTLPDEIANASLEAEYYEYSKAANPIGTGLTPKIPFGSFPAKLHESGPTRIIPFDLSRELECPWKATSPALLANFIRILPGESISTSPNCTSELYYCLRGQGSSRVNGSQLFWKKGDFVTLPSGCPATHQAEEETVFYWVHDEPLLSYLGAKAVEPRFQPTVYPAETCEAELERVKRDPNAAKRSRISVLLANRNFPQTRTVSHTLWAMYGILPAHSVQPPHRHQSVALDLITDCPEGCYSLIGRELDENGNIKNPFRADWRPGAAFVTPPGFWHAHHNESDEPAHLIPIQDAGLQTYLRSLDIRFSRPQS